MGKVDKFLRIDHAPVENESGTVRFIKYKVEPFFEYTLYLLGILIIVIGAFNSIYIGLKEHLHDSDMSPDEILAYMRIRLSESISLGLTFILGAEVVKTFRVPNIYQLIKVALLVLLRQMITVFLDKDVSKLRIEYPNLSVR